MTLPKLKKKIKKFWKKSAGRGLVFGTLKKALVVLLVVGMNWPGIAAAVMMAGYFRDNESSFGNVFSAATLDFSLSSPGDFSPDVTPVQVSNRTINVVKDGALDFRYEVSADNLSGGLCGALNLSTTFNGHPYSGLIAGFNNFDAGEFDAVGGNWQFTVTLTDNDPNLQGQICTFDFVFDGTQIGGTGFSDTETIQNTVRARYWDPPVVLNEFLPNAVEYPEFVEIFNKTDYSIDLDGFYIKANSSIIPIDTDTTSDYSDGSTEIPANGWLVVTTDEDLINNSFGTIALYNGNDVLVDSYDYGSPDHNVNNTPGWTNDLVGYWPFDEDVQDLSGNDNNGTNYEAAPVAGKINQGLSFDGINDYVEVADSASLDIASQITVEGWIKLNSFSQRPTVAGKWRDVSGVSERGYLLTVATDGSPYFYISTTGADYPKAGSSPLSTGQWYHLVGTYDGVNIKLYVNGVLSATTPQVGNIHLNNESLLIGANDGWGGTTRKFTNGLVDEVKIYNRVLDADEVSVHYNAVGSPEGAVPVDKSYARIPDGVGVWVDPMPTPGGPNKLVKTGEENELENVAAIEEQAASLSFSETLGTAANAITEFVLGEEDIAASASAETVVDIPELVPVSSESVEPSVESEISPEILPESSATPEPADNPQPPDSASSPQAGDDSSIQAPTEPAIPVEPVIIEQPTEPAPPPADPPAPEPAPAPAEAPAPAPEAPAE